MGMPESQAAMCYPHEQQYERWKEWAGEMDMTVSEFMCAMVEAGYKKFDRDVEPMRTNEELREQRDDCRQQLREARARISDLEDQLHGTEREAIVTFLRENPGASYKEIGQHITDTAPKRVTNHLDAMLGNRIYEAEDGYYLTDETA